MEIIVRKITCFNQSGLGCVPLCVYNMEMYVFKSSAYREVGGTMLKLKDNIKTHIKLNKTVVIKQIDAQNLFYNKFISCLYMFRAQCAHRQ